MGWNSLRDNPISNFVLGGGQPNQPGVGTYKVGSGQPLIQDPTTGYYYDPASGTTFTDASAQFPVTDPNVAQQVATNVSRSQAFMNQLQPLQNQEQGIMGEQGDLAAHLRDVISGKAPSLAGEQLQSGLDAIQRQGLSTAAGTSGAGAPLASLMASRNTGSASIAANNAAAQARVKEQTDAQQALGTLLAQRGLLTAGALDRNLGAAENFNTTGANLATNKANNDAAAAAARAKSAENFGYSLLKGIANGSPSGSNPISGSGSSFNAEGDQPNAPGSASGGGGGLLQNQNVDSGIGALAFA